ncbi:MAG: flagellar basal body P-ring protein FlgI [Planctomycetota bacterium]|jgi:flagellar basal body P-ring protein FlgI
MNRRQKKTVCVIVFISFFSYFISGCQQPERIIEEELVSTIDISTTIGSMVEVFAVDTIRVEGFALVGGLKQTGSSQCPPQIRPYLEKYIQRELRKEKNVARLIESKNTAVVIVGGLMPAAVAKNQRFDVKVIPAAGTQTTSLERGMLYGAELWEAGKFGIAFKSLASAEGPIFIDKIDSPEASKKIGYVLGGGKVLDEYKIGLALREPSYRMSAEIRNRINERFVTATARATSSGYIELKVPPKYLKQKEHFISLVKAMYLTASPSLTERRITGFVIKLAASVDKDKSEIALEAIGTESLGKLKALLNSYNEEVRLRAARCMLNMGNDEGLDTLRNTAMDTDSAYRFEALDAITTGANRNDAAGLARRLLREKDFEIRLAAYESLRKFDDVAIVQKLIADNFYLEQISQTKYKSIFVSRSGVPRIVLFGAPLFCRKNIFVQSADGNITLNAPAGQEYVTIIRKHPTRANVRPLELKSSFELSDIIRTLCESPLGERWRGLNTSYDETIALLKRMVEKRAVDAEFRAGPLPKID